MLDEYRRFAKENDCLEIDLSGLTVEVSEILLGGELFRMEKLAIGGGFVGASLFVNPLSVRCWLVSAGRHPDCLGLGRNGLVAWEVRLPFFTFVMAVSCFVTSSPVHRILISGS